MTVEDLVKQMMFLLEQGKGHYKIDLPIHTDMGLCAYQAESFELIDEQEGVLIY